MGPKQLITFCLSLLFSAGLAAKDVPRNVTYCGMNLQLSDGAREKIQGYVDDILSGPRYFNEMVKRAHTYMPFIEEAFDEIGVPDDLKYLAIQESALRPDVVSSSQAVGFWQFKEPTAKEFGLQVNDKIDERMHIFRSSQAAAKYFKKANHDFDNWVYAVMAYFHGVTGAIEHTDPQYYGSGSMIVANDIHWYPLKAIAHKLAYEEAVSMRSKPLVALVPYSSDGEYIVKRILQSHQAVDEDEFFLYNKWIRDKRRLPKEGVFTYYIPKPAAFYTGHIQDPVKIQLASGGSVLTNPRQVVGSMNGFESRPNSSYEGEEVPDRPAARPSGTSRPAMQVGTMAGAFRAIDPSGNLAQEEYVVFNMIYDLHYGKEFILYNGWIGLPELSERLGLRMGQLLMWNNLTPSTKPEEGTILYLTKPRKADFHVVRPGESILSISEMHRRSARSIIRKNHLDEDQPLIYVGQKLYLRKKRPRNEKIIILRYEKATSNSEQTSSRPTSNQSQRPSPPDQRPDQTDERKPSGSRHIEAATQRDTTAEPTTPATTDSASASASPNSKWIIHQVRPGETLWQIAQKYSTRVEIIKRINNLEHDNIRIGQELKILSRVQD